MCDNIFDFYLDTVAPQLNDLLTRIEILEKKSECPPKLKKIKTAAQELDEAVINLLLCK